MKKIRILIILVVIIIIILIVSILLLINYNNHKVLTSEEEEKYNILNNSGYLIKDLKPEKIKIENIYFSVDACIQKAISYAKENNEMAIYKLLNLEYIKEKGITKNNAIEVIGLKEIQNYKTKEIYQITGLNYSSYYLKAIIQDNKNLYFNINWDNTNDVYDFKLLTQSEYEKYITTIVEDTKSKEKTIEKNDNNSIPYKYLTKDDIAERYFLDYIESSVNFIEDAYNSLDNEYKKAKFGELENFRQYIQNNTNIKDIYDSEHTNIEDYPNYMEYLMNKKDVGLEKYMLEEKDGYTQCVCIDSFNNYYIFNITGIMQYSLMLDTYTLDIPEFVTKYKSSNPQEKVILNINKFMLAINDKDYKYAYSILADSFKEKNFKTQQDFENYVKTKFFEKNEFSYQKFGNEANTYYTYEVKITDASKKSNQEITKTFIVLLEKETDFKLSFNV